MTSRSFRNLDIKIWTLAGSRAIDHLSFTALVEQHKINSSFDCFPFFCLVGFAECHYI